MKISRRSLMRQAAVAAAVFAGMTDLSAATTRLSEREGRGGALRVLLLGGTGNIGPHFARAALARGHRVAVFSRGMKDGNSLPREVERLVGDRNADLDSIRNRDWDAVLDLATFTPAWIKGLGQVMANRIKHYLFISTVSVYDHPELNDRTIESSQVIERVLESSSPVEKYGHNKWLCEREATHQFGCERSTVLRPAYIVGPGDHVGFLAFWPLRMQRGGVILAPGDSLLPFQCIDVRDLAEFAINLVEQRIAGSYNAVGPQAAATLGEMLDTVRGVTSAKSPIRWVPAARLAAEPDKATWVKPMFWSWYSESLGQANIMRMSNQLSLSKGLKLRPLATTLADTIKWYEEQPTEVQAMMAPGFSEPKHGEKSQSVDEIWKLYLRREREILSLA